MLKPIVFIIPALLAALIFVGCAPEMTASPEPTSAESRPSASSAASPPSASLPASAPPARPSESATVSVELSAAPAMRLGTTSPRVREAQQRLMDLGYLGKEKATQYYDAETHDAVALFQQNAGLPPTGELDASSLAALMSEEAPARIPPITPSPVQTPTPPPAPEPTPEIISTQALSGVRIGLDPGHQAQGNPDPEPVAPGSDETKAKVASGTQGISSGVAEFAVNMQIAEKLRALLEAQGAEVIMSRESNNVDISNSERAQMMNEAGVDLVVRLHCNGDTDTSRSGAFMLIPAGEYTQSIQETSRAAGETVLNAFIEATGAKNLGLSERSDQTGFNWSTVPVITIEMGHMSNRQEDQLLISDDYQERCAKGICQGLIDFYAIGDTVG